MLKHSEEISNRIEIKVENRMNSLDARFMSDALTQEEYNSEVKALRAWADEQYDLADRARGWKANS